MELSNKMSYVRSRLTECITELADYWNKSGKFEIDINSIEIEFDASAHADSIEECVDMKINVLLIPSFNIIIPDLGTRRIEIVVCFDLHDDFFFSTRVQNVIDGIKLNLGKKASVDHLSYENVKECHLYMDLNTWTYVK